MLKYTVLSMSYCMIFRSAIVWYNAVKYSIAIAKHGIAQASIVE